MPMPIRITEPGAVPRRQARPIASRQGVCPSCFDLYVHPRRGAHGRCRACATSTHRSEVECRAIQSFWVQNPTRIHLVAFAAWGRERELERARRNLDRFWRRAYRWSVRPVPSDRRPPGA